MEGRLYHLAGKDMVEEVNSCIASYKKKSHDPIVEIHYGALTDEVVVKYLTTLGVAVVLDKYLFKNNIWITGA